RDSTLIGNYGTGKYDNIRYGGYYSQDEIRDVVAYAESRHITIIPEIEMPGHSSAALAAYPEYGCVDKNYHVQNTWGVFEDIFCPSEKTFSFLEDVLTEVMDLFPGEYIHIGGDEAPKHQWEESALAQQVIKREGLKDEHELQSYFIRRIEKFLNAHGRQIIGWDEILEGGLAPRATVMSWRGEAGGIEAAKMGHDVIMTPGDTNYLDHYQADAETEPIAIGGLTTLADVYGYEPIPKELTSEEAKHVLGAQGNVWTEYMHSPEKVEYMAYPRAVALSEVLWSSNKNKNWEDFLARLQTHFQRLDILGVNYAKSYKTQISN
ncbi:MAG: family 20 glycosylhydrolase, partial [Balneolaceae bacterium]